MFSNLLATSDHQTARCLLCAALLVLAVSGAAEQGWAFFGCALLALVILDAHASLAAMRKESDAELLLQAVDRQNVALADCLRLAQLLRAMLVRRRAASAEGGAGRVKRSVMLGRSEGDLMLDMERGRVGGGGVDCV